MSRRREFDTAALDYRFTPGTGEYSGRSTSHRVEAVVGGQSVGHLDWNPHNGMVDMVKTGREHRGKGIATAMWGAAHVHAARHGVIPPKHSDVQFPDGKHWMNTMIAQSGPGKKQPGRKKRGPVEGQEELF